MVMKHSESHLLEHGVRPTAVRILVWEKIEESHPHNLFSLKDIEEALPYMDRSSIFRTLRLFEEKDLLHNIEDGSGSMKYCICHCEDGVHRGHVHFQCTKCGTTYCLEDVHIPDVDLPENFLAAEYEYIVKGVCPKCR